MSNRIRIFAAFTIVALLAVGVTSSSIIAGSVSDIRGFIDGYGVWSVVVFGLVYLILCTVGVSTAALTVLAGALFSFSTAILMVLLAASGAAAIAFLTARYLSKRFKTASARPPKRNSLIQRIESRVARNGFAAVAIMRLSLLPYIPLSYACGFVSTLRFKDYIAATVLSNMLTSSVFILLGASFAESWYIFVGALLLVIVVIVGSKFLKRQQQTQSK